MSFHCLFPVVVAAIGFFVLGGTMGAVVTRLGIASREREAARRRTRHDH